MRAPKQIVPTGNVPISIGLGALTALTAIIAATPLPEELYAMTVMASPFLSGFFGNFAHGSVEFERTHILPVGLCSFLLFYFLLFSCLASGLFWDLGLHTRELGIAVYVTIFPPFFLVALTTALVGGIFGWLTGLAVRR